MSKNTQSQDLFETINNSIIEALSNTHTILIAKVTKVNEKTINARPVVNRKVNGKSIQLPIFPDVPPIFLQGGSSYTAHPIAVGDYCLLLVNERCFDKWYHGQDFTTPPEYRMHDYSDCFAIVGINPLGTAITIPQVITHIGDTYEEGDYIQIGNRTQTGDYLLTGNLTVDGDITCTGTITATVDVIGGGISLLTHVHGGISPGASNTAGPQ
jgi:hypothetical protein